jgi:hypothetical protein
VKPTPLLLAETALVLAGCGEAEKDPARERYIVNALESRNYPNNHPTQRFVSSHLIHRTSVSDFRHVPYSCSGHGCHAFADDRFGDDRHRLCAGLIPVTRYETSCAGLFITGGGSG